MIEERRTVLSSFFFPGTEKIMPMTTANRIELYYEIHGSGAPLILIGSLGVAVIRYTDYADLTDLHGFFY